MKSTLILFMIMAAACCLASCKKKDQLAQINNAKPTLSLSTEGPLTLSVETANNMVLTLSYDNVDFGINETLAYLLQIAPAGTDFKADSMIQFSLDRKAGEKKFTGAELNKLLLNEFSPAGQTINFEIRLITSPGKIISNTVPITITTYEDWPRILEQDFLYTPGAYQGWDPASAKIAKMYVTAGDKVAGQLTGSIYMPDPVNEFKFTPGPQWDNSYGSVTNTGNAGTLQYNGGGNFSIKDKGYYQVDLDLTAKTWKASLSNYSIIGDAAISWDTDVELEFDPATQTLFKELPMKAGEWKFRKNHAWSGGDFPKDNLTITEAGTYKILLDMRVPSDPYWKVIKQ
ncbi:SusE domain-containing protein [Niabella beijingensis]|uniref:SusE domain-containing protein n=1 Tax=Niabella beijingensis TaxID=2872700 RepID=UPI001CBEF381|nr:SusE domain-containing protein [Niabella beijingensis]MBZ4189739.1 SusE domain-containing protein [Niabella beijingensis]